MLFVLISFALGNQPSLQWNMGLKSKVKKLQPLQSWAIRNIGNRVGFISTQEMQELNVQLHLLLLEIRRKTFILTFVYIK